MESNPLVTTDVFPTSSPLDICLIVQNEITDSPIMKYPTILPINDQVPYSSGVSVLVITREKIKPVTILTSPTINPIRPE